MERPRFDETDEEFDARSGCSPRIWIYAVLAVLLLMCGAVLFPVWQAARPAPPRSQALSNVKQIVLAVVMYSADCDDRMPLAANWMDATMPYSTHAAIYHSPAIAPYDPSATDPYGTAYRRSLNAAIYSKIKAPEKVATVFDSTNLSRNASGELGLLPNPPRYQWDDHSANVIGFADGHAGFTELGLIIK